MASGGGFGSKTGLYFIDQCYKPKTTKSARCITARYNAGVGNHPACNSGVLEIRAVLTPRRINKRQNGRRMKEAEEPMFTLTGQDRHGVFFRDGRIRRLTPKSVSGCRDFRMCFMNGQQRLILNPSCISRREMQ